LENIGLIEKLPKISHVKLQKKNDVIDVRKLLKYFNISTDPKDFYNDILNDEVTVEEDCQE
jgi:hypothetical protein